MPLAEESTLENFCKEKTEEEKSEEPINIWKKIWEIFQNAKYKLKHKKITHAPFFNFKITRDIFNLMTKNIDDYRDLGWNNIINSSSIDICVYDSVIAPGCNINKNIYIESSYIHSNAKINSNVIISSVEIKDKIIPNDVEIHMLNKKIENKYAEYMADYNPKEKNYLINV